MECTYAFVIRTQWEGGGDGRCLQICAGMYKKSETRLRDITSWLSLLVEASSSILAFAFLDMSVQSVFSRLSQGLEDDILESSLS